MSRPSSESEQRKQSDQLLVKKSVAATPSDSSSRLLSDERVTREALHNGPLHWVIDPRLKSLRNPESVGKMRKEPKYHLFEIDLELDDTPAVQVRKSLIAAHAAGLVPARLNLTGAILDGVQLPGIDLSEAVLIEAKLMESNLSGALLDRADIRIADLRETNLDGASLRGAICQDSNFRHATFRDADLTDADLSNCDLRGADLSGADLTGVNLSTSDLSGACLAHATLVGARIVDSRMVGCDMRNARFSGVSSQAARWDEED